MRLEARKYLIDIQESAGLAAQFTAGKDYAQYEQDPMLRMVTEWSFAILGDACIQFARADARQAARISSLPSMIAFCDALLHPRVEMDDRIVWDVIESKLPLFIREVGQLLEEPD